MRYWVLVAAVTLLFLSLYTMLSWGDWSLLTPQDRGFGYQRGGEPQTPYFHILKGMRSFIGATGFFFFSFSLGLASRWKGLERLRGLDQIYHDHHRIGALGFFLLLAHPLILALRWLPTSPKKAALFLFPIHQRLSDT